MGIEVETEPLTEVINGDMSSGTGWTIGGAWTIAGGIASFFINGVVVPNDFLLAQDLVFKADRLYRFKWDIFNLGLTPPNKAGVNLFGNVAPGWDVPGTYTYYTVGQGAFPLFKNLALSSKLAIGGDSFDCDNVSVIDVIQYMLNIYGFNPSNVNFVEFYPLGGSIYQFIISNFDTPLGIWIKADVDDF